MLIALGNLNLTLIIVFFFVKLIFIYNYIVYYIKYNFKLRNWLLEDMLVKQLNGTNILNMYLAQRGIFLQSTD